MPDQKELKRIIKDTKTTTYEMAYTVIDAYDKLDQMGGRELDSLLFEYARAGIPNKYLNAVLEDHLHFDPNWQFRLNTYKKMFHAAETYPLAETNENKVSQLLAEAESLSRKGKQAEAIECLEEAHKLKPGDEKLLALLGKTYFVIQNFDKAIGFLEKAHEINPDDPIILTNLGAAYLEKKDFNKVITFLDKAYGINPDDPIILTNLGYAYLEKTHFDKAIMILEKGVRLYPLFAEINNNLAVTYYDLGKQRDAQHYIETAFKLKPDNSTIQHNREIIMGFGKGELLPMYH